MLLYDDVSSGDHEWARTIDFFHVKEVLYQLSYAILLQYFVGRKYSQEILKNEAP